MIMWSSGLIARSADLIFNTLVSLDTPHKVIQNDSTFLHAVYINLLESACMTCIVKCLYSVHTQRLREIMSL